MDKKKLLITGSSGFVGTNAKKYFESKYSISSISLRSRKVILDDFLEIDCVLFLTGIAHTTGKIDENLYYKVNCDLAIECAKIAKEQGVNQFIYLSSTKVYGDIKDKIFNEQSACNPTDAYGMSKYQAETALLNLNSNNFHVKIVRPPLVYGKGVKANFKRIIKLSRNGLVIPLKNINNKRSMIYILNLMCFLDKLMESNQTGIFITSDRKSYSSSEIVEMIIHKSNRFKLYFSIPNSLRNLIRIFNSNLYSKLFSSFEIDPTLSHNLLSFQPPYEMSEVIDEFL